MKIFLSNLLLLAKRMLFLLAVYSLCRFYFVAFHVAAFVPFDFAEFALIFANGLKFDVSALFFTNALFIVLHLLPCEFAAGKKYQMWLTLLMVVVNSAFIGLNIIDTGYYSFQNSRSSADFVSNILFSNDTISLLPQYLVSYWYHSLAAILFFASLWFFFPRYRSLAVTTKPSRTVSVAIIAAGSLFVIALCGVGIRGLSAKPLRIVDAAVNTSSKFAPYVLNSTFTVLKTIGKSAVAVEHYFPENEAKLIYSAEKHAESTNRGTKKNLVVIIMESMSNEIVGELNGDQPSYTPFLDSLITSSLVFENAFSNGRTSIQSVPSVAVSLPQLMDVSLITSQYAANSVNSLASLLADDGYATSFFHGAFNGSMGFDKYCAAVGYQHYYGQDEFTAASSDKSAACSWGIFDDAFLPFVADNLNIEQQPFFSTIFTISAHHPYELPPQYAYFAHNTSADLAAVRYADYSLKLFFEKIKKTDWYANTIFVLVADHTAPYSTSRSTLAAKSDSSRFDLAKVRIPLLVFDPSSDSLRGRSQRVVQQLDIMPSMLHLLGISADYVSFGNDFFDPRSPQFSFSYNQGIYTYIDSTEIVQFDGARLLQVTDWKHNSDVPAGSADRKLNFMKAYIQDYTQRMVYNQLRP